MKRKVPERIPKPQLQIRSPSQRRQGLRRSSDSLFPPNPTDTSCRKGVKSLNLDDENRRPPRIESDNAKTSEYAFFKKLKEDVSNNHQSCCSKSNQACRGSSSKPRDSSGERTSSIQNKCDNIRSAGVNKDAIPEGFESSHALNGSALRETELKRTRACAMLEDLNGKERYMVDETENTLKHKGKGLDLFEEVESQTRHTNVFERKRRKLLQWVRETSFPEIDDYCMDGSNLVSVLLNRLIPKSCENNSVKNPKLMEVLPSEKSMPLPSLESDIHFKELQLPPAESLMDLGSDPFSGDSTLSCLSKRSRGIVSCSYSPTSSTYKNYLDYTVWEPDSALLLGGSAVSCPNIDSNSILPLEEFGLATSGCVKELDILYPPHKYMHGREPYAPMLGWDFDMMDEGKLSNLSRHRADLELLGSCTMSCPMIDSVNVFPFSDNGLREPSHVKELDIFCQPSEYLVEKPQCAPMLGWNFDSTNEESNAHSLSRYRAGCELLRNSAVSGSMGGADSVVPFKEYGLRASGHVEELDIFCRPNKYLDGKEPCTLMLDWDFDYAIEERNSSNLFRHSAEYTPACLTSYNKSDVERLCLEGRYDLQSDFQQIELPSTLSCIPNDLNQAKGCIYSSVWEGGTTIFPLQNDHWFKRKIINEGHPYSNAESLLQLSSSSGEHYPSTCHALEFPGEEGISSHLLTYDDMNIRCLTDSTHKRAVTYFMRDNVNIHNSSALCLQISLNRQKAWPLGIDIDKASWDVSEREISFGCDVNQI